jgi:hypothetical protein
MSAVLVVGVLIAAGFVPSFYAGVTPVARIRMDIIRECILSGAD